MKIASHLCALDRQFGGADVGGDGVGFENRHCVLLTRDTLAEYGVVDLRVNIRQERVIEHAGGLFSSQMLCLVTPPPGA